MISVTESSKSSLLCCVSDAEETIAWMVEKDPMLSTDDYGRDLASVQALQRKHDTLERDLNALEERVCLLKLI